MESENKHFPYGGRFLKTGYLKNDTFKGYKNFEYRKKSSDLSQILNNENFPPQESISIVHNNKDGADAYYINKGDSSMAAINLKATGFMSDNNLTLTEQTKLLKVIDELDQLGIYVASVTDHLDGLLLFYCVNVSDTKTKDLRLITPSALQKMYSGSIEQFEEVSNILNQLKVEPKHVAYITDMSNASAQNDKSSKIIYSRSENSLTVQPETITVYESHHNASQTSYDSKNLDSDSNSPVDKIKRYNETISQKELIDKIKKFM